MSHSETPIAINPEAVAEALPAIPSPELLLLVVETFRALANPTRVRILYALVRGPLCVRDLSILAGVSESAISHQLRYLRLQQLVKPARDGNVIYYTLNDPHVVALFKEAEYHADHAYRGLDDHPYPLP